jgi:hypothetical protein
VLRPLFSQRATQRRNSLDLALRFGFIVNISPFYRQYIPPLPVLYFIIADKKTKRRDSFDLAFRSYRVLLG